MKISVYSFVLFLTILTISTNAQNAQQSWDTIKNLVSPAVTPAFQSMFDAPYKQPLADYGWEDGLEISRDGLHLYALYSPMDLLGWTNFFTANYQQLPLCNLFGNMNYLRPYAGTYGIDMATNFFGCDSFANIDILYAHRNSLSDPFSTWQLSGITRAGLVEGGPSPLFSETNSNLVDLFMFTGNGDIWMISNTAANPSGINNAVRLPSPVNPDSNEFIADNAFVERINGDTVVLIYEKYTNPDIRTFMVATSYNTGLTWNAPQAITTITNSLGHIEHPSLYRDVNNQWWLYFSIDFASIVRAQQLTVGNWDSWATPESIITMGNALAIGEPTVTQNGDISFSLGYMNLGLSDSTDMFDLDPWFLPRKTTTNINKNNSQLEIGVYPNPFANELIIKFDLPETCLVTIEVISLLGEVKQIITKGSKPGGSHSVVLHTESYAAGLYICKFKAGNYSNNTLIVKQ